ncbi:hypothetical protein FVE85_0843 [Porphyridium purpureum]|uniref:Uncharacterized protein n=1 Tax=Porphyridium purpureum TaxID=35688 RepID=A0A5J4Z2G3_PORPP|nr:hypothetical protein FVE85_0843 [Porphyridium purpureum]|eukprot:POR2625..scf208_2
MQRMEEDTRHGARPAIGGGHRQRSADADLDRMNSPRLRALPTHDSHAGSDGTVLTMRTVKSWNTRIFAKSNTPSKDIILSKTGSPGSSGSARIAASSSAREFMPTFISLDSGKVSEALMSHKSISSEKSSATVSISSVSQEEREFLNSAAGKGEQPDFKVKARSGSAPAAVLKGMNGMGGVIPFASPAREREGDILKASAEKQKGGARKFKVFGAGMASVVGVASREGSDEMEWEREARQNSRMNTMLLKRMADARAEETQNGSDGAGQFSSKDDTVSNGLEEHAMESLESLGHDRIDSDAFKDAIDQHLLSEEEESPPLLVMHGDELDLTKSVMLFRFVGTERNNERLRKRAVAVKSASARDVARNDRQTPTDRLSEILKSLDRERSQSDSGDWERERTPSIESASNSSARERPSNIAEDVGVSAGSSGVQRTGNTPVKLGRNAKSVSFSPTNDA